MTEKKEKTIYDLEFNETMIVDELHMEHDDSVPLESRILLRRIEVTRVPGGWIYNIEYPRNQQNPVVFIPFNAEFKEPKKNNGKKEKEK